MLQRRNARQSRWPAARGDPPDAAIRPEGAAAYSTPAGVVVVLAGAVVSVLAYRLTIRLGRLPEPQRWFG